MKIFNRFGIILILFLGVFVYGADTTTKVETEFTKSAKNSPECAIECPNFKDGFFGRIADFNYESGETSCFVYSKQAPTKILATVINNNPNCSKNLINTQKIGKINSNNTAVNNHLNSVREEILKKFTDGGSSEYINLPKYMVAGLMADDTVIDLNSSISANSVILNTGYTNDVNLNFSIGDNVINKDMLSRTKDALANSVTFVINFLNSSDKILLSFKVTLFLFVGALSVFLIVSQKTTKKISQLQDHEDIAEKVLLGLFSIVIFFLSLNKVTTTDGQISQTGYQQLIRPLMYLGIDTADKLTETATKSVLKYKFSEVGVVAESDLQVLNDLKYKYMEKRKVADSIKNLCFERYKTDEISSKTKGIANNYIFPNSEYISTAISNNSLSNNTLSGMTIDFYNKTYLNDEKDILTNELPSVSYCFKNEKLSNELSSKINDIDAKLNSIINGGGIDAKIVKNINGITELTYKNIAEFGFAGIGSLATSVMAFNNFSLIQDEIPSEKKSKVYEEKTAKIREATGYEVNSIADGTENVNFIAQNINEMIIQAPLMMLPMAGNLKTFIESLFEPVKASANFLVDLIPNKWLSSGASTVTNLTIEYYVLSTTLSILTNIVAVAPLIAIIGASFLVMSFYFLSVGILYIVIPFASVFAFSTGNLDIIKNLIKFTFILAIKPVLIVVSVIMAFFVYEMFQSLNEVLVSSMFEPLFLLANNMTSDAQWYDVKSMLMGLGNSSIFLFLKSSMMIVSSLITVFVCFYLVFNGANIILDILGMRDGGFDVGNTIGDKVENKSTISKMNTVV